MAVKRANGQRIGRIPYGSDLAPDEATLVSNEAEQAVIQEIRAMRSLGMNLERIAKALTTRHVPTKTGQSSTGSRRAVARILTRSMDSHPCD
jgi:hypothetical protein